LLLFLPLFAAATVAVAVVIAAVTVIAVTIIVAAVTITIAAVGKCMTNKPLAPSPPIVLQHSCAEIGVNCLCRDKKAPTTVMLVLQQQIIGVGSHYSQEGQYQQFDC
jgi:hypothetical protein